MINRKRVLVLTSTFPRWQGDTEPPFVFELSRRLSEWFDVVVLAPHAPGAMKFERMGNLEVHRFRYFFTPWQTLAYRGGIMANLKQNRIRYMLIPFFLLAELVSLLRLIRKYRVDVIHAHWLVPQGLTVSLAAMLKKNMPPLMCTSHGGDLMGLNGRLLTPIKRWIIHSSSLLTVVSNTMMDYALSLGATPTRLQVISMGVDTRTLFTPDPAIGRIDGKILFVGRLVEKKGCTYLLAAMPEILRRHPGARLGIVGSGADEEALMQQADHLGIAYAIHFYGAINNADIPDLYRRATVFVAPSIVTPRGDQEGLGLVLAEALACECPVVATDLPAIRDIVIDGVTGLVCRQKDSSDLADKVCSLLDRPDLREKLGKAGRSYAQEHFDWTVIASRYANLIEAMASERA